MNKTDVVYKSIEVSVNKDLGKEVDEFLRGEVELVGIQISREGDKKVAMIKYVDRNSVKEKYAAGGAEFKEYMYGNYYHTIEVSVPQTKNLAEKMNEVLANDADIEVMSEFYFSGNGTKNVIILYASRSQVEKNEATAQEARQAEIEERAQALAQSAVKEPDMEQTESVLEKYNIETEAKIEDETTIKTVVEPITTEATTAEEPSKKKQEEKE